MVDGYQMLEASMDRFERKMDKLIIIMAKWYQVSLLAELFSKEYSNPIIQKRDQSL